MNKIIKSLCAVGLSSCLMLPTANAATYEVIDKNAADTAKYTYSQAFNNAGQMAISGVNVYNFPVLFDLLTDEDFVNIVLMAASLHFTVPGITPIQDPFSMYEGDPVANDLYWVVRYLESKRDIRAYQQTLSPITTPILELLEEEGRYQKVGASLALTNEGNQTEELIIFDRKFNGEAVTDPSLLSRSTTDYINGINERGRVYGNGSAPYLTFRYTQADGSEYLYFARAFTTRGFFTLDDGKTIIDVVPPTDDPDVTPENLHFGGQSAIHGLDSSGVFAVGSASTRMSAAVLEQIFSDTNGCQDPNLLARIPFQLCLEFYRDILYFTDAIKWTIDSNNETTAEILGLLVEPHPLDTRTYRSVAQAINNKGVAVGFSHGWFDEKEFNPAPNQPRGTFAVLFKDGEVKSFTDDHSTYFDSRAYDINDQGIAVGHTTVVVNGSPRTKAFFVDTNEENPIMTIPESYFRGAASTARAINNHGFFVGEGEVETHNDSPSNPRRKEAYVYDMNLGVVYNLNDLTECQSPYTIIEARDINDDNVIAATALVKENRKDSKGEDIVDNNGVPLQEDVLRSVLLKPIFEGEIEPCPEEDNLVERQGASINTYWLLGLLLITTRRRVIKRLS